ncbi:MAG TPA: ATP-binding protein [Longimicrobiaceae bacterium]|nr:ATP-binding protein [Longimicrobiaceae bacterium]
MPTSPERERATVSSPAERLVELEDALQRQTQMLALMDQVAHAAITAETLDDAIRVGAMLTGWPVGHAYFLDEASGELVPSGLWHLTDPSRFAPFRERTHVTRLGRGEGLPGRAMETAAVQWGTDASADRSDPRATAAGEAGIRAGIAIPVRTRRQVVAVLEFYSTEAVAPHQQVVLMANGIGLMLGRMFEQAQHLELEQAAREAAERRVREEAALRDAVAAVNRADTVGEVIHQIAGCAVAATGADSAFVERVDEDSGDVVVVAAAGDHAPPVGTRVRYAGSSAALAIARGAVSLLPEGELREHPLLRDSERCRGKCSALVLPLVEADVPFGSLTVIRSPERPHFRQDQIDRARLFSGLAALAFRKVALLQEARERRDELERVTESRTRLMRGFSHDVKNPLGAADGFAQLLAEGVYGELTPPQLDKVERIRRSIGTALDLIHDLLELSRAESGQIEIRCVPMDVGRMVQEVAEEYRASAEAKGLQLEIAPMVQKYEVQSDPTRLRQILGNLLSNAVKYTPSGAVRVSIVWRDRPRGGELLKWYGVQVADTGLGIPAGKKEHIFQEFTRLEPGAAQGVGLGLAISRRVARLLGGDITVRSVPGEGSAFTLWIPLRGAGCPEVAP